MLAVLEVERVDTLEGSPGEVRDAVVEAVVGGEFVALGDESLALLVELAVAGFEFTGAGLEFVFSDHSSLVQVGEAAPFSVGGVDSPFEAGQLGGEQFVVGCRCLACKGGFSGGEEVGTGE